ncbi:hypothetical protein FE257_004045 [Aspergillus nanangensis]|uniref:Protein phosphatase 4 core regulatory subunit R2 n=1 Tax=Aspergillus nanangensis TaxID=2582783 RepID=A0AAD4CB20_ASPNN|nr:hypothetical protein FE257_004045 [Aspergillus nanangensis]
MSLDEATLETAANGGLMDLGKWPAMVEPLLERLEYVRAQIIPIINRSLLTSDQIVYNVFPMPRMPAEFTQQSFSNPPASLFLQDPNSIPSSSNKENDSPADLQTAQPTISSPMPPPLSSSFERIPESHTQPSPDLIPNGTASLPAPLMLLLDSIQSTLRSLFSSKPPHTIQRLAELIIRPNSHYRTLPAYLRAVDRVVSVTSSADVFPLHAHQSGEPNGVLNGAENSFILADHAMGDESLGGALLTPIPWVKTSASPEAGNGVVVGEGLETLATQSLPQEMEDADSISTAPQPTVHLPQPATGVIENQTMEGTGSPPGDAADDVPHARGPQVIRVEDMGLQDGQGVEMTLTNPDDTSDQRLDDAKAASVETTERN